MAAEIAYIQKGVDAFLALLEWMRADKSRRKAERQEAVDAIHAVLEAVRETRAYQNRVRKKIEQRRNIDGRGEISRRWFEAYKKVCLINEELGRRCLIKSNGWAEPKLFNDPKYKHIDLSLDKMQQMCEELIHVLKNT